MTLVDCKASLREYVISHGKSESISKITTNAWAQDKVSCVDEFVGMSNVRLYVDSIDVNVAKETQKAEQNAITHNAADIEAQTNVAVPKQQSFWDYLKKQINGDSSISSE